MSKKIFSIFLIFVIIAIFPAINFFVINISNNYSGIVSAESTIYSNYISEENMLYNSYTHSVFLGIGTSQSCKPCHTWNEIIHETYISGDYDLEYVEMIEFDHNGDILNLKANEWSNTYGIGSYPTSIFDRDYQRIVGNHPEYLVDTLNTCGNRAVADISGSMTISWLENGKIQVNIDIQNNEETQYNGYIRAFITEIISRYDTYYGDPYHFGFLDYAYDLGFSVEAGGIYTNSIVWDGNEHQDEHGDDFGDIDPDNIQVSMAIYNNDGFVDETVAARISGNNPPDAPTIIGPINGKPGEKYEYIFTANDFNNDNIYYYIEWGDGDIEDWIGPYNSGEEVIFDHIWNEKETFSVRARVRDIHGTESQWAIQKVTIPVSHYNTHILILRLLDNFSHSFPILKQLLWFTLNL